METMVRANPVHSHGEISRQLLRFALSGGISTGIYFITAFALIQIGQLGAALSSAIAYGLGTIVSYALQSRFTFRIRHDSRRTVGGFLVVSLLGFILAFIIVWVMEKWGISRYAAVALVCLIIPSMNFLLLRWQVFRKRGDGPDGARSHD